MGVYSNYFVSGAIIDNKLYWTARDGGELSYYDFDKDRLFYVTDFKPQKFSAVIASVGNTLIGVSMGGIGLWKYDIENGKREDYKINCRQYALDWITDARVVGNLLMLLPSRVPYIVWINIENGEVEIRDFEGRKLKPGEGEKLDNQRILVGQSEKGPICLFDIKDKKGIKVDGENIESIQYPDVLGVIEDVFSDGEKSYAINEEGKLFVSSDNEKWEVVTSGLKGYSRLFCEQENVWVLPKMNKPIVCINAQGERKIYEYPKDAIWREKVIEEYKYNSNNYYSIYADNKVIFTPFGCDYFAVLDREKNEVEFIKYTNFDRDNMLKYFENHEGLSYEESKPLEYYLDFVGNNL